MRVKSFKSTVIGVLSLSLLIGLKLNLATVQAASLNQSGAIGIQGEISSSPPSKGATIAIPSNGTSFSSVPIIISGTCPSNLLIKVFSNNIFIGSAVCTSGSYSVQASLFSGQNILTAIDYDALNQAGPTSNSVTITYNNAQFTQFGTQLTLSSIYGELGANPGSQLTWPLIVNGGVSPYAISVDWGDGTSSELISLPSEGSFNINHTYQVSGIYRVIVKATDKNGEIALLQLVGQADGAITHNSSKNNTPSTTVTKTRLNLWPNVVVLPLILIAFWGGKQYYARKFRLEQQKYDRARRNVHL